jgi:catechol 2,3-dioxygenase-like lactoylglutathione lyase family enzyme
LVRGEIADRKGRELELHRYHRAIDAVTAICFNRTRQIHYIVQIEGHLAVNVDTPHIESSVDGSRAPKAEMKLEVVVVPVADVDRAKRFYVALGWRLDLDFAASQDYRVVQCTPAGSACSIIFGIGITPAAAGSVKGGIFHHLHGEGVVTGLHPQRRSYGSYESFSDPEGNGWFLQEVTARLPGHELSPEAEFSSSTELARALRRAATAHDEHKRRTGRSDNFDGADTRSSIDLQALQKLSQCPCAGQHRQQHQ